MPVLSDPPRPDDDSFLGEVDCRQRAVGRVAASQPRERILRSWSFPSVRLWTWSPAAKSLTPRPSSRYSI